MGLILHLINNSSHTAGWICAGILFVILFVLMGIGLVYQQTISIKSFKNTINGGKIITKQYKVL